MPPAPAAQHDRHAFGGIFVEHPIKRLRLNIRLSGHEERSTAINASKRMQQQVSTKRSDVRPSSLMRAQHHAADAAGGGQKNAPFLNRMRRTPERRTKIQAMKASAIIAARGGQRMAIGLSGRAVSAAEFQRRQGLTAADRRRRKQHKQAYENNPSARPSFRNRADFGHGHV